MIYRNFLFSLTFLGILLASTAVKAEPKPWVFGWCPSHWEWTSYTKFSPYLEDSRQTQVPQWENTNWYVEDWKAQREHALDLVQGFYQANVLKDQKVEDGIPVLVVGPSFYRLSGYDKRRVAFLVDNVYGVTENAENNIFILRDWRTHKAIGVYTQTGLQLH